jgi:hypothetical protein
MLYRKQFSYFAKLILPVYALSFIQILIGGYATATLSFELMAAMPFVGLIVAAYGIVTAIISGKSFNKQYMEQLNTVIVRRQFKILDENIIKMFNPSALIPVLFVALYSVLSIASGFAILAITADNLSDSLNLNTTANHDFNGVSLSQTYTNEAEGITFKYPSGWEIVPDSELPEYYDDYYISEYLIVRLDNKEDDPELFSFIEIQKYVLYRDEVDGFYSDREIDLEATNIDGMRTHKYTDIRDDDGTETVLIEYSYAIRKDSYYVKFECRLSQLNSLERVFNAIMESYTITRERDTKYFLDEYKATIAVYPDGDFTLLINSSEGYVPAHGTYELNGDIYTFDGYAVVDEFPNIKFIMRISGDTLVCLNDDDIVEAFDGTTMKGNVFYQSDDMPDGFVDQYGYGWGEYIGI